MKAKSVICAFLLIIIIPYISYSQINGKVNYVTILESEDFTELESHLYINGFESLFLVNMKSEKLSKSDQEKINITDDSEIEFSIDFTQKNLVKYEVYMNQSDLTVISQNSIFQNWQSKPCVVTEKLGSIDWEIIREYKQIGNFKVQKATTSFRGRNYVAWFTPDIPISIGPWKFHGLPGLIMEVKDEELGVQFLFSSIQIPYETEEKIKPPSNGEQIPIHEFARYHNNFANELTKSLRAKLSRDAQSPEISIKQVVKSIERDYN